VTGVLSVSSLFVDKWFFILQIIWKKKKEKREEKEKEKRKEIEKRA
jgi:hypothetical protein